MPAMLASASHPLTGLSATRLAELVRSREVSATESVDAHLARIEAVNPGLNAIVTLRASDARADARSIDRAASRDQVGPLSGVPFTVKDTIATAGVRTTCGSRTLADHVPSYDATAVARLKSAGAILLGKTNCPEFGAGIHTWNALFGETKSPLPGLTPGGSSGGESAAIAAGCSPLGVGTDFGGSLRWPAHCTGIAGLRPTVGRVPGTGQLPATGGFEIAVPNALTLRGRLQVIGPLARTVGDIELALAVLEGPDGLDPAAVPVTPKSVAKGVDGLKVAWCDGGSAFAVGEEVVEAMARAADALADAGADVEESLPDALEPAAALYTRLRELEGPPDLTAAVGPSTELLAGPMRALVTEDGPEGASLVELAALWAQRDQLRAEMLRFFDRRPVLVMPVATTTAFRLPVAGPESALTDWDVVSPSRAISLFGFPAMVVPFGASDGPPVGVQVIGRPFREDEIFVVARALEASHVSRQQ